MATVVTGNKKGTGRQSTFSTTTARPAKRPYHFAPGVAPGGEMSPTPSARPNITVVPHPRKRPGGLRAATTDAPAALPMGQRGSRPTRIAKNLSARSPMFAATLCASFAVSLLCLYVTAYARVNAERLQLARLRQELKLAERREILLKGAISQYHLSATARAQAMGMVPAPPEAVQVLTEDGSAPETAVVK